MPVPRWDSKKLRYSCRGTVRPQYWNVLKEKFIYAPLNFEYYQIVSLLLVPRSASSCCNQIVPCRERLRYNNKTSFFKWGFKNKKDEIEIEKIRKKAPLKGRERDWVEGNSPVPVAWTTRKTMGLTLVSIQSKVEAPRCSMCGLWTHSCHSSLSVRVFGSIAAMVLKTNHVTRRRLRRSASAIRARQIKIRRQKTVDVPLSPLHHRKR